MIFHHSIGKVGVRGESVNIRLNLIIILLLFPLKIYFHKAILYVSVPLKKQPHGPAVWLTPASLDKDL